MTQHPAFRSAFVLSLCWLVGCTPEPDAPASTGTCGSTASGSGGAGSGSGGQTGSGGTTGSGGSIVDTGGTDTGAEAAAETAPPSDGGGLPDPGTDGDGRYMMARPPMPREAMGRLPGVMAGTTMSFMVPTGGGFPGRQISVYTPAGYQAGTPIAFTVCHDGQQAVGLGAPAIWDNLHSQGKMPKMVGIFIPPVNRSPEYDTVDARFSTWITTQVLPAVEAKGIKLTTDPEASGTMGHSSGGILAFTMAWFQPERYRRVLSLSGSFTGLQNPGGNLYNNLVRMTMPLKPIRTSMIAGTNDLAAPRWTQANETMGAALMAAGYHYRYFLINGGTHNPGDNVSSLPDLLTYLWRGYPSTGPTR